MTSKLLIKCLAWTKHNIEVFHGLMVVGMLHYSTILISFIHLANLIATCISPQSLKIHQ